MLKKFLLMLSACFLLATALADSGEKELSVAIQEMPTSLDPHYHDIYFDVNYNNNIFEPLIQIERKGYSHILASNIENISPTEWRITLKDDVLFHDSSPLSSEDVVFSYNRVSDYKDSKFLAKITVLKNIKVESENTIILETHEPESNRLFGMLAEIRIIKKPVNGSKITKENFDNGQYLIGTGAYRFKERVNENSINLIKNTNYHNKDSQGYYEKINLRFYPDRAEAFELFLSGNVDLIEFISPEEFEKIEKHDSVYAYSQTQALVSFLQPDVNREVSPFVLDKATGEPLAKNPLKDKKVREAISLAINREHITQKAINKIAIPAYQMYSDRFPGYVPSLRPQRHSIERAKELISETPFRDGFKLIIATYLNPIREKVLQQLIIQLAEINIDVEVKNQPASEFFSYKEQYHSMAYYGFIGIDALVVVPQLLLTHNRERSEGIYNLGRYSSSQFDSLIEMARREADFNRSIRLTHNAIEVAMKDYALIPLYHRNRVWGVKKGLTMSTNIEGLTLLKSVTPLK